MDFWYSYYLLDSIEGKMLKIFTHRSCDISSREPNYHQILIFENEDQKKEFDMYVFEHFDDHSDEEINDKYKYQILMFQPTMKFMYSSIIRTQVFKIYIRVFHIHLNG